MSIPYNKVYTTGRELAYIQTAIEGGKLSGDGPFTEKCREWLQKSTTSPQALLTHSCTAALEMCAILCDLEPGDEVIMPSFAFVSSANAIVLQGAVPVFVDIREDTLNIDETLLEQAITSRTKAIVVIHYAGVAAEMDAIMAIAAAHDLVVIEDAAQGLGATYKGRALGTLSELGAISFHETKNIVSGEGGALLVNDSSFAERAEIIREKGTNRAQFFRGQVDKYTWVDVGSSYLPSELIAAFLLAQLEDSVKITERRLGIWNAYHDAFRSIEERGNIRRPKSGDGCVHNGHIYYLILPNLERRTKFINDLKGHGIQTVFHYVPLHGAPMGKRFGKVCGSMWNTENLSERLVRLPLWIGLEDVQDEVIGRVLDALAD
jgi:dTDP-4-amino-4,6-dideoxygalactose transaminase